MKAIDLSFEGPDYGSPETASPVNSPTKTKTHYPSIYIEHAPEELADMPDEGTATITYKVIEKGMRDRNGEKSTRCELEIHSITPQMGSKAMEDSPNESEAAFDRYIGEGGDEE